MSYEFVINWIEELQTDMFDVGPFLPVERSQELLVVSFGAESAVLEHEDIVDSLLIEFLEVFYHPSCASECRFLSHEYSSIGVLGSSTRDTVEGTPSAHREVPDLQSPGADIEA